MFRVIDSNANQVIYHLSKSVKSIPIICCATSHPISHTRTVKYRYSTISASNLTCSSDDYTSSKSRLPHYDLTSFLDYAARIKLNPKSTVYVGTHYEYTVQRAFERMGMFLKRIGGRDDFGTDIIGKWSIPSAPYPIRVLIQCKAHAGKVNPAHIRELEGAFTGASIGRDGGGALGLLVSPNPASKGVRDTLGRSRLPMGFVLCSPDGKISQMMWNKSAGDGDLIGVECGLRFQNSDINQREVVLTWKGKPIC